MSEMIIQENRIFREHVTGMGFIRREVMWKGTAVILSASRGQKRPLGESGKEAGVGRLGIDLELLIKGIVRKKRFPLPGGVQAGLGA